MDKQEDIENKRNVIAELERQRASVSRGLDIAREAFRREPTSENRKRDVATGERELGQVNRNLQSVEAALARLLAE